MPRIEWDSYHVNKDWKQAVKKSDRYSPKEKRHMILMAHLEAIKDSVLSFLGGLLGFILCGIIVYGIAWLLGLWK